jgi:hypothetical protein
VRTLGRDWSPNIESTKIAKHKIKWYLTVITIDFIDLKKNMSATFELRGAKNSITPPLVTPICGPCANTTIEMKNR